MCSLCVFGSLDSWNWSSRLLWSHDIGAGNQAQAFFPAKHLSSPCNVKINILFLKRVLFLPDILDMCKALRNPGNYWYLQRIIKQCG